MLISAPSLMQDNPDAKKMIQAEHVIHRFGDYDDCDNVLYVKSRNIV